MPSEKQRSAARKNIRKAANIAKKKRTIAHLPKSTRTALGKQGEGCERQAQAEGRLVQRGCIPAKDTMPGDGLKTTLALLRSKNTE
jgi:hypothetical protein